MERKRDRGGEKVRQRGRRRKERGGEKEPTKEAKGIKEFKEMCENLDKIKLCSKIK